MITWIPIIPGRNAFCRENQFIILQMSVFLDITISEYNFNKVARGCMNLKLVGLTFDHFYYIKWFYFTYILTLGMCIDLIRLQYLPIAYIWQYFRLLFYNGLFLARFIYFIRIYTIYTIVYIIFRSYRTQ